MPIYLVLIVFVCTSFFAPPSARAVPPAQKKIFDREIYYYDVAACGSSAAPPEEVQAGNGSPEGTTFPDLDPAAMAKAIDKYMKKENPSGKLNGLGATIVASAKNSNISPFLIVAIAQKESGLGDPGYGDGFNVRRANNSFGRSALASQPNVQGGDRLWYKWSTIKASVDHTAQENKNAKGGGDAAAYLKEQYGKKLDSGKLEDFMNEYAPEHENDTALYIKNVKEWIGEMADLTKKDGGGDTSSAASASKSGSSVYMLGDSISVRSKDLLESGFKSKDFKPYINASVGRSIKGAGKTAGFKTDGLMAASEDKERIDNASIVVVALGTNTENNFEDAIKKLVDSIKSYDKDNSGLKIYWANVFSKGGSNGYERINAEKINKTINKMASSENFTVIDTTDKDIELDDSVHPKAPEGTNKFADTIVNGVAGAGGDKPDNPSVGNNCTCIADKDVSLRGSENEGKIFNFFTDKGLKPLQAAGIVGNIHHESGYEPQRQEGIFNRKVPANQFPAAGGGPGWGIVQFTPGSKFIKPTKNAGKDPNDLGVQLEFIWQQLQGKGPVPENPKILQQIKATNTVREAVLAFQGNTSAGGSYIGYERPADQAGSVNARTNIAKGILTKYGSGGGSGSTSGAVSCTKNESSNEVSGKYSLPIAKKWYKSNPEKFTSPHHDNPDDPGVDIAVPRGTEVYSVTDGKIASAPNEGGYGKGVTIVAPDGVRYDYGHGTDGGSVRGAKKGDTVKAGQLIMHVNDTGNSRGDHLHLSILVNGKEVCPQKFLVSIAKDTPLDPKKLPSTGCTPV